MSSPQFDQWFATLTGHDSPRPWQRDLAEDAQCRNRLIRIPTGLGKTEGVLSAWTHHRLNRADNAWPCRLIWCLPMRVLVEQTAQVARDLAFKIAESQRPKIHVAMGGEDADDWFLYPERPAIIIGTQDMLLSRALNRGYASARARWPMEFGLLSQDALWVMDEVQLMDVGLATSAQLQAFRSQDAAKNIRPCQTWWMSATLQPDWLETVDTVEHHAEWVKQSCTVQKSQRRGGLWFIHKTLALAEIARDDAKTFAKRILAEHAKTPDSEYGQITLVVCNTVERACRTFDALRAEGKTDGLELVHSRFRPEERERWRSGFLNRSACSKGVNRIIVATQVVEAGVDISAGCLITELAPWPSLVQRFGRCARYGGSGRVFVVDRGRDEASAAPYSPEEIESAWAALQELTDVGISSLEEQEEALSPDARTRLFPYSPAHLLMRREFDELFDTTPDLTGADLDISRFIRSGDERDLQVFWIDVEKSQRPSPERRAQRNELCALPFRKARDWICGEETKTNRKPKLRKGIRAWIWDYVDGEWLDANRAGLLPGRVVCVDAGCGGYRTDRGFDPESRVPVPPVQLVVDRTNSIVNAAEQADEQQDGEDLSFTNWKTIGCHCSEVVEEARRIASQLGLSDDLRDILMLAGRWHDWGKAHVAFQNMIVRKRNNAAQLRSHLWAKSDNRSFGRPRYFADMEERDERCGFRHELASALGLFSLLEMYAPQHDALLGPWSEVLAALGAIPKQNNAAASPVPAIQQVLDCSATTFDLLVYLVASHHGKVRVGLHAGPKDQEYRDLDKRGLPIRGVRELDQIPPVALNGDAQLLPQVALTLSPAALGLSTRTGASWRERCLGLLDRFGPSALAYLEALLRAADIRASQSTTADPSLTSEPSA